MIGRWFFLWCVLLVAQALGAEKVNLLEARSNSSGERSLLERPKKAYKTYFGVYPVSFFDFDLSRRSFKTSFYAWWRTANKDYKPDKSVEITNATDYYSKFGAIGKNGDEYFTYVHYYATIRQNWNIKHFPFDRQFLEVRMEDFADINYVAFEPDLEYSHLHSELWQEGWDIIGLNLKKSTTEYQTNFGDISTPRGEYSRLTFVYEIKRQGWRPFFNYFIGFFIAFFLCNMIYLVNPRDLTARANLSLGAIVTSVGNKYILDQVLPITSQVTLADAIQITTFIMISTAILSFILMDRFARDRGWTVERLKYINRIIGVVSLFVYISVVGVNTYQAIIS